MLSNGQAGFGLVYKLAKNGNATLESTLIVADIVVSFPQN